eukprot:3851245-Pyramimonas_sp.AAC.1
MSGHSLSGGFNHGATVFPAKNLGGDSLRDAQRKAKETRPLFLGNTDNKTFASLLSTLLGDRLSFLCADISMGASKAGVCHTTKC